MTQRTINLYDGLEALYYFDSDYFDGTKGEIKDKSGHGRHATAVGGPTVGVNGPNDFEAASFDGSDDYFDTGLPFPTTDCTVSVLLNHNSVNGDFRRLVSIGANKTSLILEANKDINFSVNKNNTRQRARGSDVPLNEWILVTATHETNTGLTRVFIDDKLEVNKTVPTGPIENPFDKNILISTGNGINIIDGEIALVGIWKRVLSNQEIEDWNRITAPRRAQL